MRSWLCPFLSTSAPSKLFLPYAPIRGHNTHASATAAAWGLLSKFQEPRASAEPSQSPALETAAGTEAPCALPSSNVGSCCTPWVSLEDGATTGSQSRGQDLSQPHSMFQGEPSPPPDIPLHEMLFSIAYTFAIPGGKSPDLQQLKIEFQ